MGIMANDNDSNLNKSRCKRGKYWTVSVMACMAHIENKEVYWNVVERGGRNQILNRCKTLYEKHSNGGVFCGRIINAGSGWSY